MQKIQFQLRCRCIGGSKIIWDNFPDSPLLSDPEVIANLFTPLFRQSPVIILLHRDNKIEQAISRTLAAHSGVFHRKRPLGLSARMSNWFSRERRRGIPPKFKREEIQHNLEILKKSERALIEFVAASDKEVINISYESLVRDPLPILNAAIKTALPNSHIGKWSHRF